jgi:hypothetical protein
MPTRAQSPRRRLTATKRSARKAPDAPPRALLVVDQRRLQGAAWAQVHTARKRLEKVSRDLHRHEEIDSPAYEAWLHRTFPLLVTTLRELEEDAVKKARRIHTVQAMAFQSGRSVKRLWREEKERELHARRTADEEEPREGEIPESDEEGAESFQRRPSPERTPTARDIYRRLVQRLHPDRGGTWTADRQRLWHEVQQAWGAGDADWLARLEVDWETANEVLGPTSPLSRLYRAIEELDAARRDTERKLAGYRRAPAWRFTLMTTKRGALHERVDAMLRRQIGHVRRELRYLDAMIAAWEHDWTRADQRANPARRRRRSY